MQYFLYRRFLVILIFTVGFSVCIYRLRYPVNINITIQPLNILSNRIDQRLQLLQKYFDHLNISMLLDRPSSNQSLSITFRCQEWCGGWGDRVRGMTSTFILAILTRRRFYIDMPNPCVLTNVLIPNLYDWRQIQYDKSNRKQLHIYTTRNDLESQQIYYKISSTDFIIEWSQFEDIYISTNSDYVTPALANKYIQNTVRLLNISSSESSLSKLFPLLYEILFRPTDQVQKMVNQLLMKLNDKNFFDKQLICLHMRIGKNPTMMFDNILAYRDTMMEDIVRFVDKNLTINKHSLLFITSDSMKINEYILNKYNETDQSVSIPGPIIHIDRSSSFYSSTEKCEGFLKVIADFYVLGECDTLIMARSGFSEWASRRRYLKTTQFHQLYLYCRGIYQITGYQWKRPYNTC